VKPLNLESSAGFLTCHACMHHASCMETQDAGAHMILSYPFQTANAVCSINQTRLSICAVHAIIARPPSCQLLKSLHTEDRTLRSQQTAW
jgi:hypothetical protein